MTFEMKFSQIDQCFRPKFENFVELGDPTLIEGNFTENGDYNAKDEGANGYSKVTVNVQPPLQDKTVTENGTYKADEGFYGLGEVAVDVPSRYDEGYSNGYDKGYEEGVENAPPTEDPRVKALVEGTLTELISDGISTVRPYGFYYFTQLEKVYLPSAVRMKNDAFANCSNLHTAILGSVNRIESMGFYYCHLLVSLIWGYNNGVATMANTFVFNGAYHILGTVNSTYNPEGKKDGYIYVPLLLVADYRVATNWVTFASQIMPFVSTVEELTDIDGTTYDHACVWSGGEDFTEYYFNGTAWEVFTR